MHKIKLENFHRDYEKSSWSMEHLKELGITILVKPPLILNFLDMVLSLSGRPVTFAISFRPSEHPDDQCFRHHHHHWQSPLQPGNWHKSHFSIPVDSRHLKESIERAEFSLSLELWFGDQAGAGTGMTLTSTRVLQLNFHPCRGLHYHLPVLFDYFHLAAVSLGIHASLVALHQPYIKWVYVVQIGVRGGRMFHGEMIPQRESGRETTKEGHSVWLVIP